MSEQETRVSVRALLEQDKYLAPFRQAMGDKAPQFVASIIQASNSGLLAKADSRTIIAAAFTACCLDLPIDKNLGFAHIVPYAGKAQFQMGYKGYIQLALRSGQYLTLNDFKVNKAAFVSYDVRSGDLVLDADKLDEYDEDIAGYAFYFKLNTGFEKTVYWSKEKVEKHATRYSQAYKKGKKDSPWFTQFDTMALKTIISNTLRKYGILSVQMQTALKFDQAVRSDINDDNPDYIDGQASFLEDDDSDDKGKGKGKSTKEKVLGKLTDDDKKAIEKAEKKESEKVDPDQLPGLE